ncbi:MAG: T9SS type A sorting domain-containing protein [Flavobacteriales bacterium]|nr:T9SS type A sorting domain-containing protein [Flavobacteriales bacterium]
MVQRRFAFAFVLLCSAAKVLHGQHCFYTLRMFAADGNGWGGSYVTVGTNYTGEWEEAEFTLEQGSFEEVQIAANVGQTLALYFTSNASEVENIAFELVLFDEPVYQSTLPLEDALLFAHVSNCLPEPVPQTDCWQATYLDALSQHTLSWDHPVFTGSGSDLSPSNQGCLEQGEQNGVWAVLFDPSQLEPITALYAFAIVPDPDFPADYDLAIWGPMAQLSCPPSGPPIRCSYATGTGSTGLAAFSDEEQDVDGDGWVSPILLNEWDHYLLYISRKDNGPLNFTIQPSVITGIADPTSNQRITLHPNPATERCTLTLPHGSQGTHQVHVHDAAGRRVMHQTLTLATGSRSAELDLHSLQAGAYVVHLRDAQGQAVGSTSLLKH